MTDIATKEAATRAAVVPEGYWFVPDKPYPADLIFEVAAHDAEGERQVVNVGFGSHYAACLEICRRHNDAMIVASCETDALHARVAASEAHLSGMLDAYQCLCGDTGKRYDQSPSSRYQHAMAFLAKHRSATS